MKIKIRIKYIFLYLLFNISGCLIAIRYRIADDLIYSDINKYTLMSFLSIGISYIGISIISLMISRNLILKPDTLPFFSPYDFFINSSYLSTIVTTYDEKKFKKFYGIISSLLLALTIIGYQVVIRKYEEKQLEKYGIIENVIVKKINYDHKHNPYMLLEYQNKKQKVNFHSYSLKENDSVKIIYSQKNPSIVKCLKVLENK